MNYFNHLNDQNYFRWGLEGDDMFNIIKKHGLGSERYGDGLCSFQVAPTYDDPVEKVGSTYLSGNVLIEDVEDTGDINVIDKEDDRKVEDNTYFRSSNSGPTGPSGPSGPTGPTGPTGPNTNVWISCWNIPISSSCIYPSTFLREVIYTTKHYNR